LKVFATLLYQLSKQLSKQTSASDELFSRYPFNGFNLRPYTSEEYAKAREERDGLERLVEMRAEAGPYLCFIFSFNFEAVCRRLSPVVPEPTEGIPLHNSKMLECS